jgi:histidinol dehydrogenase
MKTYINPQKSTWDEILKRPLFSVAELRDRVQVILSDIQSGGIHALRKYTEQFDGVIIGDLAVSPEEVEEACQMVDANLKNAISIAAGNIQKFHESQVPQTRRLKPLPE